MNTTEHLTVDQIIDAVNASEVPPGDPDDHDMLCRLADEIDRLRCAVVQHRDEVTSWNIANREPAPADRRLWTALTAR